MFGVVKFPNSNDNIIIYMVNKYEYEITNSDLYYKKISNIYYYLYGFEFFVLRKSWKCVCINEK